jgi:hypothetical protein
MISPEPTPGSEARRASFWGKIRFLKDRAPSLRYGCRCFQRVAPLVPLFVILRNPGEVPAWKGGLKF